MLFEAMGIEDNPYLCFSMTEKLNELAKNLSRVPDISGHRKQIRQCIAALRKAQKLWRQLGPMRRSIDEAGFLRINPHATKDDFAIMEADCPFIDDLTPVLEERIQDIDFLIGHHTSDYRKRLITKHVVEPFLDWMDDCGVVPSRKLPRTRVFEALYDVLGLDHPRDRVTEVTIRNAVRRRKKKVSQRVAAANF